MSLLTDEFPSIEDHIIEDEASSLLADFLGRPVESEDAPIPVETIAEKHFGYDIDIVADHIYEDPNLLGGIVFEDHVIQVNESIEHHEGRYSFTIAHELGHHVLHRDIYLENQISSTAVDLYRETGKKPLAEIQADQFASALLMPKVIIEAAIDKAALKQRLAKVKSPYEALKMVNTVMTIGKVSNVSKTALLNRLVFLGFLPHIPYQENLAKPRFNRHNRDLKFWLYLLKKYVSKVLPR